MLENNEKNVVFYILKNSLEKNSILTYNLRCKK